MSDLSPARPDRSILRVAVTALAGSSIEWYDFFLYGTAAALVFPSLFFSHAMPPLAAQIAAFGTFAAGFMARPVGGVVFGHFGDRVGRKKALVTALMVMGLTTTGIGLLPTYAQVGVLAPIGLIVLRFIQGIAIGGQWGGAVLLATETAPAHRRGFFGSFAQVGVPVGMVLANLVFLIVSALLAPAAFMAWGWRIPFLFSVVLIGIALYIQLKLEDSPAFRALQALKVARDEDELARLAAARGITLAALKAERAAGTRGSPVLQAFRTSWREIALAAGAFIAINGNYYVLVTFTVAYGTKALKLPQNLMLLGVMGGSLAMAPALVACAAISDRFGRRRIYMLGAVGLGLWSFAVFPLIQTGQLGLIALAIGGGLVVTSLMYGPQAALLAELFPVHMRYSGASLGYQLGSILGGGFAPIIATALLAKYNSTIPVSIYMAAMCAVTFVSVWLLKETYRSDFGAAGPSDGVAAEAALVGSHV